MPHRPLEAFSREPNWAPRVPDRCLILSFYIMVLHAHNVMHPESSHSHEDAVFETLNPS